MMKKLVSSMHTEDGNYVAGATGLLHSGRASSRRRCTSRPRYAQSAAPHDFGHVGVKLFLYQSAHGNSMTEFILYILTTSTSKCEARMPMTNQSFVSCSYILSIFTWDRRVPVCTVQICLFSFQLCLNKLRWVDNLINCEQARLRSYSFTKNNSEKKIPEAWWGSVLPSLMVRKIYPIRTQKKVLSM